MQSRAFTRSSPAPQEGSLNSYCHGSGSLPDLSAKQILASGLTAVHQLSRRSLWTLLAAFSLATASGAAQSVSAGLPNAPEPAAITAVSSSASDAVAQTVQQNSPAPPVTAPRADQGKNANVPADEKQPKRILGVMPNFRAISAGETPPPPTSREAFKIATENSFDYSSFVFTALTSLIAKGTDAHPDLGKGVSGLWAYTWRGYLDKTDGDYMVIWALPTLLHEDERYYAMGHGSKWKRLGYSFAQIGVARNYQGRPVLNIAELAGRAGAQAVSTTYYPSSDQTLENLTSKYAYALLRDGATNAFREFWPDISVHVLHRDPATP